LADPMTEPTKRAGGLDPNARGLAVLAVAVVVGLLLLLKAGGGTGTEQVAANDGPTTTVDTSGLGVDESTTTTPDDTTTSSSTPTDTVHNAADVTVLVLNGGGPAGVAKTTSETIGEKGYDMQAPANASANVKSTVVYYADGYQSDAEAVASLLGKTADAVEAMPSTPPGPGADGSDVVVVLGPDTPPASSSSSSGTTTAGSSGTTTTTN